MKIVLGTSKFQNRAANIQENNTCSGIFDKFQLYSCLKTCNFFIAYFLILKFL